MSDGSVAETKNCPYCGETILAKAQKCKHCGEFLDGSRSARGRDPAPPQHPTTPPPTHVYMNAGGGGGGGGGAVNAGGQLRRWGHMKHLILTILTAGLWGFVWAFLYLTRNKAIFY